jgi:glycosyltransferase involved in cell wall biosynthesis
VLVPVRNEARCIRDTAQTMLAQRFDGELEFLFVDGASTDGTRSALEEIARTDRRVQVLDNPAGTVPTALNVALAQARGRYLVRMDAHTRYSGDYVSLGVQRLEEGDVTWVAGPAVPRGSSPWSSAVAQALAMPLGRGGSRKWASSDGGSEVDLDTGVFGGVWRRETVEALGGWSDSWPVNEDAEMAGRVLSGGGRIVCLPAMAAYYAPRDTPKGLAQQYWRFGYYRVKTSRRHAVALRGSHVAAAALALTPAVGLSPIRPAARVARASLLLYSMALVRAGLRTPATAPARERLSVPLALVVMHFSWGVGFLCGCLRLGPPWTALRQLAGQCRYRGRP